MAGRSGRIARAIDPAYWVGVFDPDIPLSLPSPDVVPARPQGGAAGILRRNRLISAFFTSATSKVLALGVQILALPLALHSLGSTTYAAYLTLQAFVGWIGLFGLGLVPALPKFVAAARVSGDHQAERNIIVSSLLVMASASVVVFILLCGAGILIGPSNLVSAHRVPTLELNAGYFAVVVASTLSLLSSIVPAIRAGTQELHRVNICAIIANCIVLAGLGLLAKLHPPLWAFFIVISLPISLTLLFDLWLLFIDRPYLLSGRTGLGTTSKLLARSSGNALAIQIGFSLLLYVPTLAVAFIANPHETAIYGSVAIQLFVALASMNMIFQPLAAALTDAHSHEDADWVRRGYFTGLKITFALCAAVIVAGAVVGPWVVRLWMGGGIAISHFMGATFGFYFLMLCNAQLHFFVGSALGMLPKIGWNYVVQSVLGLALGSVLCAFYGAAGMVAGLAIGMAVMGWVLPVRTLREIRSMRAAQDTVIEG
jgi:O-antigen/teichoic acid export membrane protein